METVTINVDGAVMEIAELDVQKVSAVTSPAHAAPFALLKSAAEPAPAPTSTTVLKDTGPDEAVAVMLTALSQGSRVSVDFGSAAEKSYIKQRLNEHGYDLETGDDEMAKSPLVKEIKKQVRKSAKKRVKKGYQNTGGPGLGNHVAWSDPGGITSEEADSILALVTGESAKELQAAKSIVLDPSVSGEAKLVALSLIKNANNGGDVTPVLPASHDASDVGAVGGPVDAQYLAKMEAEFVECADPVRKSDLGAEITFHRLRALHHAGDSVRALQKSFAQESQDRTNALVAATQAGITARPASAPAGDPHGQLAAIGSGAKASESLGSPSGANRGDLGLQGRREPEPAAQLQQIENELQALSTAAVTPVVQKQLVDLGERKTRLLLRISHEAGR